MLESGAGQSVPDALCKSAASGPRVGWEDWSALALAWKPAKKPTKMRAVPRNAKDAAQMLITRLISQTVSFGCVHEF